MSVLDNNNQLSSIRHVQFAVLRALQNQRVNEMKSKSLSTEIVFSLSNSPHVRLMLMVFLWYNNQNKRIIFFYASLDIEMFELFWDSVKFNRNSGRWSNREKWNGGVVAFIQIDVYLYLHIFALYTHLMSSYINETFIYNNMKMCIVYSIKYYILYIVYSSIKAAAIPLYSVSYI